MRTVIILFAGAMLTSATFAGEALSAANKHVHPTAVSKASSTVPVADGFGTEERFRLKYGRSLPSFNTAKQEPPAASVAGATCAAQCCKHAA